MNLEVESFECPMSRAIQHKKKTVRFADNDNSLDDGDQQALAVARVIVVGTVPSLMELSEQELRERYLRQGEFRTIRLLAEFDAREVILGIGSKRLCSRQEGGRGTPQPPGGGVCAVEALDAAFEAVACLTAILDADDLDRLEADPSDLARPLCSAWHNHPRLAGGQRGLERWVSKVQDVDRYEDAADARRVVLFHSRGHHRHCGSGTGLGMGDVAALYRDKSRFSALYARVMGEADAIAASALHRADAAGAASAVAMSPAPLKKDASQLPIREKASTSWYKVVPQFPGVWLSDAARQE
jgi:hypothetical protein